MRGDVKGRLLIIGGAEDKEGDCVILKDARAMIGDGEALTILTTATEYPEEVGRQYQAVFSKLGLRHTGVLNINTRDEANSEKTCGRISASRGIFFTGGDQLRLTSILGGTACHETIKRMYGGGGLVMGTSAGASVMSSTMIVNGQDNEPAKKCTLKMAPGLGLLDDSMIDQHFDQRGRFGRLLTGVAENPGVLGIGIDEDTAVKVFPDGHFEVIGANTVTVIDGSTIKSSNVSELEQNEMLAITGVTVHTLPRRYGFDMGTKTVRRLKEEG